MYACYIDESGHCGVKFNPDQPVEVVCGVITDITKLFKTQREHNKMLRILEKNKISVTELKAKEIYRGNKAWFGIPHEIRYSVIDQLIDWAVERSCKFIVCPINSEDFFERKRNGCPVSNVLKFPYEVGAMNVLLAIERLKAGTKKNKGKTLVVYDEQEGHDKNILKLMDTDEGLSFTDGYTGYVFNSRSKNNPPRLNEIIDIPFFSKSHISTLIQLADIVAFIVSRYLLLNVYDKKESYVGEKEKITNWYTQIGNNTIPHININPTTKDDLCNFYREIRPKGWTAKKWFVEVEKQKLEIKSVKEPVITQKDLFNQ